MGFMQNDIKIMLFTRFSLRTMCAASATKIIENKGKHIKKTMKNKENRSKNSKKTPPETHLAGPGPFYYAEMTNYYAEINTNFRPTVSRNFLGGNGGEFLKKTDFLGG